MSSKENRDKRRQRILSIVSESTSHTRSESPLFLKKRLKLSNVIAGQTEDLINILLNDFEASHFREAKNYQANRYLTTLNMLLANLWVAHCWKMELITPMSTGHRKSSDNPEGITNRTLKPLIDFLQHEGFIDFFKGTQSESNENTSRCIPTDKFEKLVTSYELDICDSTDSKPVILRDVKEKGQRRGQEVDLSLPLSNKDRDNVKLCPNRKLAERAANLARKTVSPINELLPKVKSLMKASKSLYSYLEFSITKASHMEAATTLEVPAWL